MTLGWSSLTLALGSGACGSGWQESKGSNHSQSSWLFKWPFRMECLECCTRVLLISFHLNCCTICLLALLLRDSRLSARHSDAKESK